MNEFKKSTRKLLVVMVMSISVILGITTSTPAVQYEYTELLPPGGRQASAYGINVGGAVVGVVYSSDYSLQRGFLYSEGAYTELMPPGWREALAYGINDSGTVVGCGSDSNGTHKGFIAEPVQEPTVVTLAGFSAEAGKGRVKLIWFTETEIDNAGFNIYRATAKDGEDLKINSALIAAEGSATQGATYEFIDSGLKNGKTYHYKLEDTDNNGISTFHGPVKAVPRWWYGVSK